MTMLRVELGAGARPTAGFIPVDLNPRCNPALVASCQDLPFRDGSVDQLRAVDVLEHISYRDTAAVLAEWARVLKPGGGLFVQVPAADEIMLWFAFHPERLTAPRELPQTAISGAQWRILGGHADGVYAARDDVWWYNAHGTMFSEMSLREALQGAGFEVVEMRMNAHPNYLTVARRVALVV